MNRIPVHAKYQYLSSLRVGGGGGVSNCVLKGDLNLQLFAAIAVGLVDEATTTDL